MMCEVAEWRKGVGVFPSLWKAFSRPIAGRLGRVPNGPRPAESAWHGAAEAPRSRAHALHAGELAPLLRCASINLPTGDDRRLTELSNVVAYPCRHSRAEASRGSTPCTPLSF